MQGSRSKKEEVAGGWKVTYFIICILHVILTLGRAISQTLGHRLLIPEAQLRSQSTEGGICDGRSGNGQVSLRVLRFSPVTIILPTLIMFMTCKGFITLKPRYRPCHGSGG
jgi:hypothetical protein